MNIQNILSVEEAILQRRSVKSFKTDPIPEPTLDKIIDLTREAPSSWNFQPTRIVVIRSQEQKEALAKAAWGQKQILQAPVTFVYLAHVNSWETTMDAIIDQAVASGAWNDKFGAFVRENAPGFQAGLGDRTREYAAKDAMIAATFTALAAQSFGYGTCYMNGWDEVQVKEIVGVGGDSDWSVVLVLPVGVPDQVPSSPGRLPREETVFIDRVSH